MRKYTFNLPRFSAALPGLSRLRLPLPGGVVPGGGRLILFSLSAVALGFLASMLF